MEALRNTDSKSDSTEIRLLRIDEVAGRVGLSVPEIYRRVAAGAFPRPVQLGQRARAWVSAEITTWINVLVTDRDAGGRQ